MAAGLFDRSAGLWDATTGKRRTRFTFKDTWPAGVTFSADGKTLIVGTMDNTVRFLNIANQEKLRKIELPADLGEQFLGLHLLADGKTLATASLQNRLKPGKQDFRCLGLGVQKIKGVFATVTGNRSHRGRTA